jgi:hypothetical protein
MIVAYYVPHNEGVESGIIDGPGFDSGFTLVDLYEVDASIRSFDTREEAEAWLAEKQS